MPKQPTVVSVTIIRQPYTKAVANAVMSTDKVNEIGKTVEVLDWYDDEINFTEADFIGKTQSEIVNMFFEKDTTYLRS